MALSLLVLPVGSAVVAGGVTAKLRGRRRELRTLRALGWGRSEIRHLLLQEFALIAIAGSLAAVLAAYLFEVTLGRSSPSGWELLAMPAAVVMTMAAAWWPVRRATGEAEPMAMARSRVPAAWTRRRPWMLGQTMSNLRRAPLRTALTVLVIAVSSGALGQELAVRWAFGGTLVGSRLGHAVSWQYDPTDTSVVITILVMTIVTVASLDWLCAGQRALEQRTLQAIGWSAYRVARLAVCEAASRGLAGGIAAIVIDVAASLAVAHRVPAGMLAATAAVACISVLLSLVGAGLSAAWRHRRIGVTR